MNEDEEPTREDLLSILGDAALLEEEGMRITPKGHMAIVLMEMGVPSDQAGAVAETMSNRIFLAGWTYLSEEQIGLGVEGEDV